MPNSITLLRLNTDTALLLAVLLVLVKEKADAKLILAILYIML